MGDRSLLLVGCRVSQDWVSGQKDGAEGENTILQDLCWNPGFPGEERLCELGACLALSLKQRLSHANPG